MKVYDRVALKEDYEGTNGIKISKGIYGNIVHVRTTGIQFIEVNVPYENKRTVIKIKEDKLISADANATIQASFIHRPWSYKYWTVCYRLHKIKKLMIKEIPNTKIIISLKGLRLQGTGKGYAAHLIDLVQQDLKPKLEQQAKENGNAIYSFEEINNGEK